MALLESSLAGSRRFSNAIKKIEASFYSQYVELVNRVYNSISKNDGKQMKVNHYKDIARHYEACLEKHGDSHLGVDWPNAADADLRYRIMLEVVVDTSIAQQTFLDFGCGASHLYQYMIDNKVKHLCYSGLDISEKFVSLSRAKYPENKYYCLDILNDEDELPCFDYVILNGVFTEKVNLAYEEMLAFFRAVIKKLFPKVKVGMAFNVMSKHVDWERDDLFHLPFDILAQFLNNEISRNYVFRNDYQLYEYTTYLYR